MRKIQGDRETEESRGGRGVRGGEEARSGVMESSRASLAVKAFLSIIFT